MGDDLGGKNALLQNARIEGGKWNLVVGLGGWIWAGGLRVAGEVGLQKRTGGWDAGWEWQCHCQRVPTSIF